VTPSLPVFGPRGGEMAPDRLGGRGTGVTSG
jgi:hypothetical protein